MNIPPPEGGKVVKISAHAGGKEVITDTARAWAEPEVLARHYEAAGLCDEAIAQYQRAGERAAGQSAHAEAANHLGRAITLLAELPTGSVRDAREAALQLALGASFSAVRGFAHADTGSAFGRAWALYDSLGDVEQGVAALAGLSVFHTTRGDPAQSAEVAHKLLGLAQQSGTPDHLLLAHFHVALPEFYQGKFASSLAQCEEAIRLSDSSLHFVRARPFRIDVRVAAPMLAAWNLWLRGYPDGALQRASNAVTLARTLKDPFGLAAALFYQSGSGQAARFTTLRTRKEGKN